MKIRYASDLHLEFMLRDMGMEAAVARALEDHTDDKDTVLVLAGDVVCGPEFLISAMHHISPRFKHVVYVPGNHEYYHNDIQKWKSVVEVHAKQFPNLTFSTTEVEQAEIDGVRFIFGTLWGHGGHSLADRARVGWTLNDFSIIRNGGRRFTVPDMCEINQKHSKAIVDFLKVPFDGKTVVVTHHLPAEALCAERFGTDINGGFASREEYILNSDYGPDYWIFGHTHDTYDQMFHKTRVLCNPKGYPGEHRDNKFNQYGAKFLEI